MDTTPPTSLDLQRQIEAKRAEFNEQTLAIRQAQERIQVLRDQISELLKAHAKAVKAELRRGAR